MNVHRNRPGSVTDRTTKDVTGGEGVSVNQNTGEVRTHRVLQSSPHRHQLSVSDAGPRYALRQAKACRRHPDATPAIRQDRGIRVINNRARERRGLEHIGHETSAGLQRSDGRLLREIHHPHINDRPNAVHDLTTGGRVQKESPNPRLGVELSKTTTKTHGPGEIREQPTPPTGSIKDLPEWVTLVEEDPGAKGSTTVPPAEAKRKDANGLIQQDIDGIRTRTKRHPDGPSNRTIKLPLE
jgi:hypothetical protein